MVSADWAAATDGQRAEDQRAGGERGGAERRRRGAEADVVAQAGARLRETKDTGSFPRSGAVIPRDASTGSRRSLSPRAALPSKAVGRVLYIASRFPVATETFVVNEWEALDGRLEMAFAALQRTGEPLLSDGARRLAPRVRFADGLARPTIRANLALLARRPRTYLRLVAETVRGSLGHPAGGVAKGLVVLWKAVALARFAQRSSVDHVHAHFASHPATAAWIIHRLTGVPYSVTAHANDVFRGPALLPEKVRDAAFVAACGEYIRASVRDAVPDAGRVHAIHLGVDLERFPPSPTGRPRRSRLLCIGSFQPKKAQGDLVRALALLAPDLPDLRLDLVGDGPEREGVEALTAVLGVADRVTMHGWLDPADVQRRLAEADIVVLPSIRLPDGRMEGVPTVLMEALASALPVVATDLSGVPEIVLHERTGLLVPPGRPPELAAAIRRLVEDPALAERLAEEGRRHVAAHFDVRRQAGIMGDLFERSIAGRPAVSTRRAPAADALRRALEAAGQLVELAPQLVRQLLAELVEELPDGRQLALPLLGVDAHERLEVLPWGVEVGGVEGLRGGHAADRRVRGVGAALAAAEDPGQHAGVLAEARPQEVPVLGVLSEPVHVEDARQPRALCAGPSRASGRSSRPCGIRRRAAWRRGRGAARPRRRRRRPWSRRPSPPRGRRRAPSRRPRARAGARSSAGRRTGWRRWAPRPGPPTPAPARGSARRAW